MSRDPRLSDACGCSLATRHLWLEMRPSIGAGHEVVMPRRRKSGHLKTL